MNDKYILWLKEIEFYPINEKVWKLIEINHNKPNGILEKENTEALLKDKLGKINGLYIYQNSDKEILYVGKGAPIANRLISHYRESFQSVKGDTKDQRWHKFFQSNCGIMKIYWKELEGEHERQIVEKLLDNTLDSSFKNFNSKVILNHNKVETIAENINDVKVDKSKPLEIKNNTSYDFGDYNESLVKQISFILGDYFTPHYRKSGVTFFGENGKRILKMVKKQKCIEIEFNVPVTEIYGLKVLSVNEAKEKKMGTCRWIYKGDSVPSNLVEEARRKFEN